MLYERGLAYQAESLVNYDPVDKTVLANEQVDANGCSWRSGAKVEQLLLKQWFLKIKEFQKPLLENLDALAKDGKWPEKVVAMQKNWIGRSPGTKLAFDVVSTTDNQPFYHLEVFTTRADTLFGVQYLALSLRHPLVQQEALNNASLRAFIDRAKEMPPDSKEGFLLPNITAENPVAELVPGVQKILSVFAAPYVLNDYGEGAVMGVPGHDTRDHAFWRANAGDAPIRLVVASEPGITPSPLIQGSEDDRPMTERGYITEDISTYKGLTSLQAIRQLVSGLNSAGKFVRKTESWRLRDWLISRQRYWGAPIPIIHCHSCGPVPVLEQDLPVELPNLPDSFFNGKQGNPLAEDETWKKTQCPKCGSAAERETDTMDTFMDSSWYFFRFLDANNADALVDPQKANEGMSVDLYVGGVEHAILHLLYARFISKFLASTPTWPNGNAVNGEPFKRLVTQGMVHGKTFTDPENGRFLRPEELDVSEASRPRIKATGQTANVSYEKMSKSKYNGVNPASTIATFGADATRAHMLFQAPIGDVLEWDAKKITGVQRWLSRLVGLAAASGMSDGHLEKFQVPKNPDRELLDLLKDAGITGSKDCTQRSTADLDERLLSLLTKQDKELWAKTQRTIASVTESYSKSYSLNTTVSDLMILTNTINETPQTSVATSYLKWYSLAHLVRMAAPIAPGVAEESWHLLSGTTELDKMDQTHDETSRSVFAAGFPVADLDIIPRITDTAKLVVQVDGKRKFTVEIEKLDEQTSMTQEEIARLVLEQLLMTDDGKQWLDEGSGKLWKLSETKQPHPVYQVIPDDWQVIIVGNGRLCNLVGPKSTVTKKNSSPPPAKPADEIPSVSAGLEEKRQVTALKHNSNNNNSLKPAQPTSLEADHSNSNYAGTSMQPTALESEQVTPALQQRNNVRKTLRPKDLIALPASAPSQASDANLQEVHKLVNALMRALPRYLRPSYLPYSVFPIPHGTILRILTESGYPTESMTNKEKSHWEVEFATFSTPPQVQDKYIYTANDLKLDGLHQRRAICSRYNPIFPDQLMLVPHYDDPAKVVRPALNSLQKIGIQTSIRRYQRDHNRKLNQRSDDETITVLGTAPNKNGKEIKGWHRSHQVEKIERVLDIWTKILYLWAGLGVDAVKGGMNRPKEEVVAKKSEEDAKDGKDGDMQELGEEEDEIDDAWVQLAGDNPNPTNFRRVSTGLPKWE